MIVLGIDGALGGFSASIARDGETIASIALEGNVALEAGLRAVADVMREAQADGPSIDRIACGVGPGGFTGLRITVAYAKSLAQAWRKPLVARSSFDTLEFGRDLDAVLTVVVGRPGIISARYRERESERRASGTIADVLAAVLPPPGTLVAINAPKDVLAWLAEGGWTVTSHPPLVSPPAAAIARAACTAQPAPSVHEVRADYGEAPAAKVPTLDRAVRPKR